LVERATKHWQAQPGFSQLFKRGFFAWNHRGHLPEKLPVLFSPKRIYVLPTRAGLFYGISLLVMLIAAINYDLSLGHALVFLLAALGLASIFHTWRNLLGLSLSAGQAPPVFAGDTAHFPIVLHNPNDRPRRLIRLALAGGNRVTADPLPQGSTRTLLPLMAPRRGWLAMPRITLDTVWPLGLVRAWGYALPAQACLVYPRPATAVPPPSTFSGMEAARLRGNSGDEDFAGLRRHLPGEPPQHVAWKTAARQGPMAPLQSKQFSGMAAQTRWFDWDHLPPGMDVETRLSVLARWVLDAESAGLSWGLRLPTEVLGRSNGPAHVHVCLKALALFET